MPTTPPIGFASKSATIRYVWRERTPPEVEELCILLREAATVIPDVAPILVLGAVTGMRRPGAQRAADRRGAPDRGGKEREARPFRKGWPARAPVHGVDVVGFDKRGPERTRRRFPRERQCVLVGRAHRGLATPAAAPSCADIGRRQAKRGRRSADTEHTNGHWQAPQRGDDSARL